MSNNNKYIPLGLGYTAQKRRVTVPGIQYEALFPKPKLTDPKTQPLSTLGAVELAKQIVLQTLADTSKIAPTLFVAGNLDKTCNNVFDFFYKHYQYKLDEPGLEQLRRPARAWSDRKDGIDCDCFAISVSSILMNLGIRHFFRVVKMYNNSFYQHIYVVVPKSKSSDMKKRNDYLVIDPVVDAYNFEPKGVTFNTDIPMIPVQYLNGVADSNNANNNNNDAFTKEFNTLGDGISGLDNDQLYGDFLGRLKRHLTNTRNVIAANPKSVSHIYQPEKMVAAINGLLGVWDNPEKRTAELERLSGMDESLLQPHLQGLSDVLHNDETLFGLLNTDSEEMAGLGATKKTAARKAATGKPAQEKKAGPFTAVKQAKKVAKVVTGKTKSKDPAVKKVSDQSKGKGKQVLKKVGRAVVKNNPITLSMRAGFLAAMKANFSRLASRAYWAYFSFAEAAKFGVTQDYYNRSKQLKEALEKVFVGKLKGQSSAMQKAIVTGLAAKTSKRLAKKGKLNGIDILSGLSGGLGVDPATDTVIASALAVLLPLVVAAGKIFKGPKGQELTQTGVEANEKDLDKQNVLLDVATEFADVATQNNPTAQRAKAIKKAYTAQTEAAYSAKVQAAPKESTAEEVVYDDAVQTQEENGGGESLIDGAAAARTSAANTPVKADAPASTTDAPTATTHEAESKGSSTGKIIGALSLAALAFAAIAKGSSKKKPAQELNGPKKSSTKIKTVKL